MLLASVPASVAYLCAAHAHACGAEQCMDTEALEEEEFFSCYIVFESEH